jgi:hypothetical protein
MDRLKLAPMCAAQAATYLCRRHQVLNVIPSQVPTLACFISSSLNQCVVTAFVSV